VTDHVCVAKSSYTLVESSSIDGTHFCFIDYGQVELHAENVFFKEHPYCKVYWSISSVYLNSFVHAALCTVFSLLCAKKTQFSIISQYLVISAELMLAVLSQFLESF